MRDPGVDFDALPKIDAVLVSHNHYDHLDLPTLKRLVARHNPRIFAPLGNRTLLQKSGSDRIEELDWWESRDAVTAVPVLHWSKRTAFDDNRALWCGFVVRHRGFQVYFSGDTGYTPFFAETAKRLGPMDVALLPIGAYRPRWFMHTVHMDPQAAVRTHLDLGAKLSIGMHYGTFQLTDEGIDEPASELAQALLDQGVSAEAFRAPKHGESFDLRAGSE